MREQETNNMGLRARLHEGLQSFLGSIPQKTFLFSSSVEGLELIHICLIGCTLALKLVTSCLLLEFDGGGRVPHTSLPAPTTANSNVSTSPSRYDTRSPLFDACDEAKKLMSARHE